MRGNREKGREGKTRSGEGETGKESGYTKKGQQNHGGVNVNNGNKPVRGVDVTGKERNKEMWQDSGWGGGKYKGEREGNGVKAQKKPTNRAKNGKM